MKTNLNLQLEEDIIVENLVNTMLSKAHYVKNEKRTQTNQDFKNLKTTYLFEEMLKCDTKRGSGKRKAVLVGMTLQNVR